MAHAYRLGFAILLGASASPALALEFGPGEAAGRFHPTRADFKVLIWYRLDDPLGTFKYQVYDVRKGEYTPAVDRWIADVQKNYSGYLVVVRDVDLSRQVGATDLLRVGQVVKRELAVAAGRAGIVMGSGPIDSRPVGIGVFGRAPAVSSGGAARPSRLPGSPTVDREYLKPSPTPFPVPVPFPRLPR